MILLFKNTWIKWSILLLSLSLMIGCSNSISPQKSTTDKTQTQNIVPDTTTSKPATNDNSSVKPDDNTNTHTPVIDNSQKKVLSNILQLAKQGKVINCEFPVNTTVIESVEKKWGQPDKTDWIPAAKGNYSTFLKKNVVFGFNKGSQIFEVRSLDKSLNKISRSMINDFFGPPAYDVIVNGEEIIGYIASQDYKILFVFPKALANGKSQFLDHYSVLYPRGTLNNMADDPGRQW